jgi:phosphoenolpyruvate carboxylase
MADRLSRNVTSNRFCTGLLTSLAADRLDLSWNGRSSVSECLQALSQPVFETPGFMDYFGQATPFAEVGQLKIASRPSFAAAKVDELRGFRGSSAGCKADTLPGWYGFGSASAFFNDHSAD